MTNKYLVEIRVKDWIHMPDNLSRVIAYEEVMTTGGEAVARSIAMDRKEQNLSISDCCAPDAVLIN